MLSAIAAVGAAALAASTVLVPVTPEEHAGWKVAGSGEYSIGWTPDTIVFHTEDLEDTGADMKVVMNGAASLYDLFADGVEVEGDNAHLAFYAYVKGEHSKLPKYTGIVFESDYDYVNLTWGSAPNQYMPTTTFIDMVRDGEFTGFAYEVQVGHTNTASTGPVTASVDYVTFGDTTFDFGKDTMPGKGNGPDGPGKGNENNGNGGTPPGQVDKDKNKA